MVVWVETHISEVGCAYPITSSQLMGQGFQAAASNGAKNLWGTTLSFFEPESEHSAQSACEGAALAGSRVVNFTSGQGLILMKEVLYPIAGKRLPMVLHIGARALTFHALNVHSGHDDVMGVADTGWGILFAHGVQPVGDLALIARRVSEAAEIPFMVVQDGFLTTHTIETVRLPEPDLMKDFIGDPRSKIANWMDPDRPIQTGVVQNQDSYMKGRVAQRPLYEKLLPAIRETMEEYSHLTGRVYEPVQTYRIEDAETAIVTLGTIYETAQDAVDYARANLGWKVGAVHVTCFAPFPTEEFVAKTEHLKEMTIVERMDCPTLQSNPLAMAIKSAFVDEGAVRLPSFLSCVAGLGSRDVRASDLLTVFENMHRAHVPFFVLGVDHPLVLKPMRAGDLRAPGTFSMRGHSIGGYGSITTNKILATLVSDVFDAFVQAYPMYGSEKKGLPTRYYLTVSDAPIRAHSELEHVDFVAVNDPKAFEYSDPLKGLSPGGILFLQSETPEEALETLPAWARREIAERKIRVTAIDTVKIARSAASQPDLVQRMQGIVLLGAFLKVAPFAKDRPEEELFESVEKALRKYFGRRGEKVIGENMACARRGYRELVQVGAQEAVR
jgi:pyruvate-ferredoxin/flavodoxin oxidoreductase